MKKRSGNAFLFAMLVVLACSGARDLSAQPQDDAVTIGFTCDRRSDVIVLTMTFSNVGPNDTALLMGFILGNGRKYLARELAVDVRGANVHTRYNYTDPSVPGIAGRVDPWVVELPAGSSFSIARPWSHFWSSGVPLSQAGRPIEVRARLDVGGVPSEFPIPAFQAFTGSLVSAWISVPDGCRSAA